MTRKNSPGADPEKVLDRVWDRLLPPLDPLDVTILEVLPVDPVADMKATKAALVKLAETPSK